MDLVTRLHQISFGFALLAVLALVGCQGVTTGNRAVVNTGAPAVITTNHDHSNDQPPSQLTLAPPNLSFGNVSVGTTQSYSITLRNSGKAAVTISRASIMGSQFALSDLSTPLTLAGDQSTTFTVAFTPQMAGNANGEIAVVSSTSKLSTMATLSGSGVSPGSLTANPSSLSFGDVQVGKDWLVSGTLTNSGGSSVTISQATITGSGFTLRGLTLPVSLAAGQRTTFSVVFAPPSLGSFNGGIVISSDASNSSAKVALSGTSSGNTGIPAAFMGMGMHGGIITRQPWPSEPFGALRLWDSDVSWSNVNLAPGVYDWTALDKWLAKASLHNVDTLYTFGRTPAWASSSPTDTSCGVSPGACDPPNDLNLDGTGSNQHWKDFVTAIATHNLNSTTGHIKYWEIWNEAANPPTWTGSVAQTVRMAQDARQIILGIDPQAIILSPSVIIESTTGRNFLQSFLQSGGGLLVDGIAFHGYVQKRNSPLVPENIVGYLDSTKSILATFGQGSKPLFDTEASWGDPTLSNFFDPDMRAAFLARMYLLHWSSGATRFYWYQWNNSSHGTLWSPDPTNPSAPGTVLEPGIAYGQIYDWMVGATMTSPCTANGSVWTCEFSRPNGYLAQAVWDASQSCSGGVCTASAFTFDPQYINYKDLSGSTSTLSGSTVAIGAKPILLQNQ